MSMNPVRRSAGAVCALAAISTAYAQYDSTFEPPDFSGSVAGVPLCTGPNASTGFFVPFAGDIDGACYRYNGGNNALGVAVNPLGGEQFVAVTRASGAFGRVDHPVTLDLEDDDTCWYLEFDLNLHFAGTLPAINYAGSISLQPFPGGG